MNPAPAWKYLNKGLLVILSIFVLATIASIVFLSYTLLKLDSLISKSGQSVGTAVLLQKLFINIDDAETSVRGYVISGDTSYLTPYAAAISEIPKNLQTIKTTEDTGLSAAQVNHLDALTAKRLAILRQTLDARRSGDEDAARAAIADGRGNKVMDEIRQVVESTSDARLAEISARQAQSHNNLRRALSVAAALSLFVLGICLVLIWYFQYTILRERALESTKNEFLSLASHQLRTPATNVKQYVGMLLDGYLGDITKKQRDALTIAYKNNESEIRIMNDLLDVAKLDLKRIELHRQRVNVVSIVKQVIKGYNQYVDVHSQTVTLKAPKEVMAMVDRTYFKGVIEKLVDNALKYSHDKTRISVSVRQDVAHNVFEVIVRDQGLGIQKREVPKLFMKFSRLTNEFSANTEGSGLGLYWVKQIMDLHQGSVKVTSQEGRGSKFIIRAPLT